MYRSEADQLVKLLAEARFNSHPPDQFTPVRSKSLHNSGKAHLINPGQTTGHVLCGQLTVEETEPLDTVSKGICQRCRTVASSKPASRASRELVLEESVRAIAQVLKTIDDRLSRIEQHLNLNP